MQTRIYASLAVKGLRVSHSVDDIDVSTWQSLICWEILDRVNVSSYKAVPFFHVLPHVMTHAQIAAYA